MSLRTDGTYSDGSIAADNLVIEHQFAEEFGIHFAIDNDLDGIPDEGATSYRLETHYFVNTEGGGTDNGTFAFYNSVPHNGGGTKRDIERPGFEGRLGNYMFTPTNRGDTLLICYDTETAAASGEIWDLDNNSKGDYEQILVEAMDADGVILDVILSPPGGPTNATNPYEGGPWIWSFSRDSAEISFIRMRSVGTGAKAMAPLAFDNFRHDTAFTGTQPALENAGVSDIESTVYLPSVSEWFTIAYEDLYPMRGDYDFNDMVISYRCTVSLNANGDVVQLGGEAYARARGAGYIHNDWNLDIPLDNPSVNGSITVPVHNPDDSTEGTSTSGFSGGNLSIPVINDTRKFFMTSDDPDGSGKANVHAHQDRIDGPHFSWTVTLDNPVPYSDFPAAPYRPVLHVRNTGFSIDLETRDTVSGLPFALIVPTSWQHPKENIDLALAYPKIIDYILSGGTEEVDWYLYPEADQVFDHIEGWEWRGGITD